MLTKTNDDRTVTHSIGRCWGKAFYGQLGDEQFRARGKFPGEMGDGLSAVSLGTGKSAADIATGWDHTCAVVDDGGLKVRGVVGAGPRGGGGGGGAGERTGVHSLCTHCHAWP